MERGRRVFYTRGLKRRGYRFDCLSCSFVCMCCLDMMFSLGTFLFYVRKGEEVQQSDVINKKNTRKQVG